VLLCVTPNPAVDRTAHVAELAFDQILRPTEVVVLPGGKGIVSARAAVRLGGRVVTTGICGGHAGEWLVEALARESLGPQFVRTDAETRSTYVTVDRSGRSVIVYEPAAPLTEDVLDRLARLMLRELLPITSRVIVSGSMPTGLPPEGHRLLVRACHDGGRPCLLDVGGAPLRLALAAQPDVVKVSLDEGRAAGFDGDALAIARGLAQAGAGLAIVTDGARGAAAATVDEAWLVGAATVHARNAVGSGDSFNAALSLALDAGATIPDALAAGAAAGAANAETLGAGMLDAARVAELRPQIAVRRAGTRPTDVAVTGGR
jgi:tagatose 6-phosphate kinase